MRPEAVSCANCSFDLLDVVVGGDAIAPAPTEGRRPAWLIFAGAGAAVLAVGLTAWALVGSDPVGASYTDRIPSDALFFAEVDMAELTSADSQALIDAFAPIVEAETGEPFDLDALIDEAIDSFDSQLGDVDLSFRDDIASWASGPVAVGVLPDDGDIPGAGILLVGGRDATALDAFLSKLSGLPEAQGTVEVGGLDFIRIGEGDNPALVGRQGNDLIVASDIEAAESVLSPVAGSTLADVTEVATQISRLPDNAAAVFVVNGAALSDTLDEFAMVPTGSGVGSGWTAGAFTADPEGFRVDYVAALDDDPAPTYDAELTAALPSDTVAFLRLGAVLDQVELLMGADMLGGMGDSMETELGVGIDDILAVFAVDGGLAVWPSTDPELPVNAALVGVAETSQSAFIDELATLSSSMGLVPTPVEGGYTVNGFFSVGTRDTLTLFTTDRDLITNEPSVPFTEGALYTRAQELVDGDILFALDVPAVIDLVDGFVAADDPEAADMLRCLPLGVAAGGVTVSDGTVHTSTIMEIVDRC